MQKLKLITFALLLFSLALAPVAAQGAYNNITYSAAGSIVLTGPEPDMTFAVSTGSTANNIIVGANTITIIVEGDGTNASSVTLTSTDRYTLNNDASLTATCTTGSSSLIVTRAVTVGTTTVIVSPGSTPCSTTSGGGGGGGGSTYVAPTVTPTTTDTTEETTTTETTDTTTDTVTTDTTTAEATTTTELQLVAIPAVSATPTVSEIQAAIAAILNNIQYLQAQLALLEPSTSAGAPAVCAGISFTRGLTAGSTGSDVKCMQALLNQSSDTQIALSGVGSLGNETNYFGSLTASAVGKFQVKKGLVSSSTDAGYGYVGPKTRAQLNSLIGQ